MAVQNSKVIDLQAYRAAHRVPAAAPQEMSMSGVVLQPVVVMVPVWAFFPMVPGAWTYGR